MGPLWGPFGACGVGALLMGPRGAAGCAGHPARRRGWGVLTRHHLERTISAAGRGRLCMAPAPRPRSCPAHKSAPRTSPPKSSRGGGGNRWRSTLQSHAEGAGAGRRARPSPECPDPSPGAGAMDTAYACCSSWRPGRAHCAARRAAARTFRGCSQPNGPAHGRHGRARAAAWREIEAAELAVAVYARGMGRAAA